MMVVAALDKANPGDLILVANYGDGGDAFILKSDGKHQSASERIKG